MRKLGTTLLVLVALLAAAWSAVATDVRRTTKEQLKAKIDASEALVVIDVRRGSDWKGSEFKIKGAVRMEDLDAFTANRDKSEEIVLYCA